MPGKLGAEMCGLRFGIVVPDEERYKRIFEEFGCFSAGFEGDFVCEVADSEKILSDNELHDKDNLKFRFKRNGNNVKILVGNRETVAGELDTENLRAVYYDVFTGRMPVNFSSFYRYFIQVCLAKFEGAFVHGCGIVRKGGGYLFVGRSGTGKTTTAGTCEKEEVLSDEMVCVRREGGRWKLYSSFWRLWNKGEANLENIFILHREEGERMKRVTGAEAVRLLLENSNPAVEAYASGVRLLDLFEKMAEEIPCYRMRITPGESNWDEIDDLGK